MKNTTFRKKALLSSVAMLLVALVALGSATFAWFSSNKEVTADGMQVEAAAAKGLVISKDNGAEGTWFNEVSFLQGYQTAAARKPVVLSPVSIVPASKKLTTGYLPAEVQVVGGGKYIATGENANTGSFSGWTSSTVPAPNSDGEAFAVNNDKTFAVYEVQVKSTGNEITGVNGLIKISNGEKNATDYIRVAVLDGATKEVIQIYGNDGDGTDAIKTAANGAVTDTETVNATDITEDYMSFKSDIVAPADGTGVAKFTVLVWFEGQDDECKDLAQRAIGNIELKFNYQ